MNTRNALWASVPLLLLSACGGHSGGSSGAGPSALAYSERFPVFMVDDAHAPLTPSVSGSVQSWSISPALPAGLSFDPSTGEITGTPLASALRTTYTVAATNQFGSAHTQIDFAVEKPLRYAYVTNPADRTISILALDGTTGAISRRGFVVGQDWEGTPQSFVPNPQTPFGYSTTSQGILTTWAVDPASGWLSEIDVLALGIGGHSLAVTPDGHYVFVSRQGYGNVWVFPADPNTGLLSGSGSPTGVGPQPVALALDPTGKLLAVACEGDVNTGVGSMLTLHSFDSNTGTLTPLGSIRLNGAQPSSVAFSQTQNVIYLGFPQLQRLVAIAFDPQSGDMASLGNAFSGAGCGALAIDPLGGHVWAANQTAGTLSAFSIRPDGGVTAQGALTTGVTPAGLALDPLGRFLFALDSTTQELGKFDLDGQSRGLTHSAGWLVRGHPVQVSFGRGEHALSRTSFELLATASGSNELLAHPVDSLSGAVGVGVSVPTHGGPANVAVDPLQRFAFTCNTQDKTISRFGIDPTSGALTELLPALQVSSGVPTYAAADASGRFLYVALRGVILPTDGYVNTYAINATTGALTLQGSAGSGFEPVWLGTDPAGEFLYVTNTGNGTAGTATIAVFRLDANSGLPAGAALSLPATGVWSIGFHPSGRYLYAALRTTNTAMPFQIDRTDGSLLPTDSGQQAAVDPVSVTVSPDGRFAFVAYGNSGGAGTVGVWGIDPATGTLLAPAQSFLDGVAPVDLCIDPSGKFLYSANSGADSISVFSIEPTDGSLSALSSAATGITPSAIVLLERWQ